MGKLVCRIEMDKEEGITVTVTNGEQNIVQTAVLNGASITLTSKGDKGTSTIIQDPETISVKCKTFNLEAETITCVSKKESSLECGGKLSVSSKDDMSFKSDSAFNVKAAKSTTKADQAAEISSGTVTLDGINKTEVKGGILSLSGSTRGELTAPMVKVDSSGMLDLSGNVTNLKGGKTKVEGLNIMLG